MRKTKSPPPLIDALLPGVRRDILSSLLLQPDRWWYMSDLAAHLNRPISSLQRELNALKEVGILISRRDGNRVYYQADIRCPIFPELQSILTKTSGLLDQLRDSLLPLMEKIQIAVVFGSIARSEEHSRSDIDLLVVGEAGLADLLPVLHQSEEILGREITPVVATPEEFRSKIQEGHHFLTSILETERLFIIGDDEELERLTGK